MVLQGLVHDCRSQCHLSLFIGTHQYRIKIRKHLLCIFRRYSKESRLYLMFWNSTSAAQNASGLRLGVQKSWELVILRLGRVCSQSTYVILLHRRDADRMFAIRAVWLFICIIFHPLGATTFSRLVCTFLQDHFQG